LRHSSPKHRTHIAIIVQAANVPWSIVGPLILIGIGVIILVRIFFLREEV